MFVAWHGAGMNTALAYLITLMGVNARIFLHYDTTLFHEINWWAPAILTAVFNEWLVRFLRRKNDEAVPGSYWYRYLDFIGRTHKLFWIPLRWWTFIFSGLGFYGLIRFVLTTG